jgi:hypothetical protein
MKSSSDRGRRGRCWPAACPYDARARRLIPVGSSRLAVGTKRSARCDGRNDKLLPLCAQAVLSASPTTVRCDASCSRPLSSMTAASPASAATSTSAPGSTYHVRSPALLFIRYTWVDTDWCGVRIGTSDDGINVEGDLGALREYATNANQKQPVQPKILGMRRPDAR